MGIIRRIKSIFSSEIEDIDADSQPNSLTQITANILKISASTCHCGGLATPIEKVGNIYRCIRCNKEFANIRYNLGPRDHNGLSNIAPKESSQLIDMDYYDAAVMLLTKQDKQQR